MIGWIVLVLLLLYGGTPAWAAIAEVGSGSQRATLRQPNADLATVAFPGNVTAGNFLLVQGVSWQAGSGNSAITVTDTQSTPYTVIMASTGVTWAGGVGKAFIAYGIASSSGANTVTINPS